MSRYASLLALVLFALLQPPDAFHFSTQESVSSYTASPENCLSFCLLKNSLCFDNFTP